MSTESEKGSHAMAWVVTLMLVPVLYVLSIGPVGYLADRLKTPRSIVERILLFYAPVKWLRDHTYLEGPLEEYLNWWQRLADAD